MHAQMVEDHDVPGVQRGGQHLGEVQVKRSAIHRAFQGPGGLDPLQGERGTQRGMLAPSGYRFRCPLVMPSRTRASGWFGSHFRPGVSGMRGNGRPVSRSCLFVTFAC